MKRKGLLNHRAKALFMTGAVLATLLTGCGNANSNVEQGNKSQTTESTRIVGAAEGAEVSADRTIDYTVLSEEELNELAAKEPAAKEKITLMYDGGLCLAPIPVAYHKGYFEEEGLSNIELIAVADYREALMAGQLTVALGFMSDWLVSYQGGTDIVSTLALHTGCTSAAVLSDSPYTKLEKGMKIGVAGAVGGSMHNIGLRFANHDGFNNDDFTWFGLDMGSLLAALQEKKVDAIVAYDQLTEQWANDGSVRIIRSQTKDDDFKNEACCTIGFRKDWVEKNPVTAYKITRTIYKASLWVLESEEHKKETVDLLMEKGYISGTKEFNQQLLFSFRYGLDSQDLENSLNTMASEYKQLGILRADFDTEHLPENFIVKYNLSNIKPED